MEYGKDELGKVSEIKVKGLSGSWKVLVVLLFIVIIAQFGYIVWKGTGKQTVIWTSSSGRPVPASYENAVLNPSNVRSQSYQAPSEVYWIADLAEKSLPFVVNIRSETVPKVEPKPNTDNGEVYKNLDPNRRGQSDPFQQFRDFFEGQGFNFDEDALRQYHEFNVPRVGEGSGFIISADGYIVTNAHVVADFDKFTVTLEDGTEYTGQLIGRDDMKDIAVIKIDAKNLSFAQLGDSDAIRPGEPAIAIGSPFGLKHTVTSGIVSAIGRLPQDINMGDDPRSNRELVQTDAAIHPGNSGGPLLNARGEVIGVNQAIINGADRIGFAIPINSIKRSVESIIRNGDVRYPGMGVMVEPLTEEWAAQYTYDVKVGVLVREVTKDMPGSKAGLKAGDVITEVNDVKVTNGNELIEEIQKFNIGDKITLTVYPQGKAPAKEVLVVLGELNVSDSAAWRGR